MSKQPAGGGGVGMGESSGGENHICILIFNLDVYRGGAERFPSLVSNHLAN